VLIGRCCLPLVWAVLVGGMVRPAAAQSMTPVRNPDNGHWYQQVRLAGRVTWPEARAAAQSLFFAGYRGHLATITSAAENQFIVAHVMNAGGADTSTFLGGYQDRGAPDYREPAGGWRWVTGEPWVYTSWHPNQPDNNNGGTPEHVLETTGSGAWNDFPEGFARSAYLVEYEPPAQPGAARIGILPNPVVGGQTTVGLVTLDRPAGPGDVVVTLTSSAPTVAVAPAVVVVPAGATSVTFSIATFPVIAPTSLTLTSAGPGGVRTAALQVLPASLPLPPGNLLANGSFEQPRVPSGQDLGPVRELPGWRVTRGSVALVRAATWPAAPGEGDQSLDLVGSLGAGAIEQSLVTVPGREYVLAGWMAHDPGNPLAPEGHADVFLNGEFFLQLFHRDAQATTRDMRWQRFAYRFRASGAATTLAIAAGAGPWDPGGLVLDGLSVTPVSTNLLVNGRFEEPSIPAGEPHRILDPQGLPGWRVAPGGVVLVAPYRWQPAPGGGGQMLHLLNPLVSPAGLLGIIEQSFPTEPGRLYTLTGWLSHNPARPEGRVQIALNGEPLGQLWHSSALFGPASVTEMRWQPFLFRFRATGDITSLQIADLIGSAAAEGAVLDELVVEAAEDPSPGQTPAAPSALTVLLRSNQIELGWVDSSPDETGFEIERREGSGGWSRIALVAPNTRRFIDLDVRASTTYTYRVRATNEPGASAWSNEATLTTPSGP
jgi:hypothetical protein